MAGSDTSNGPVERPQLSELGRPVIPVLGVLAVMWVLEIIDLPLDGRLDRFGIRPRELGGLDGVLFAPFLHDGFEHLIANTVPFLLLGGAIALGTIRRWAVVTIVVALVGGVATWLLGPAHTLVIGASGIVFGDLGYLVSRGFFQRRIGYIVGGLVTLVVYGGILWGLLPRPGVSWQGHVFGMLAGVLAAWILHRPAARDARPVA